MHWKAHDGQGRVADLQCLCPAAIAKVAGEMGSVRAIREGRMVAALPRWHSAAGGRQQEAATAMRFGVYFRGCSDPQNRLILGLL